MTRDKRQATDGVVRRGEKSGILKVDPRFGKLLDKGRVAHLATVTQDGRPHLVPVVYAYEGERVYIALDEKPKRVAPMRLARVRNILANPDAALLVDRYDEDWAKLAWVRVEGSARIVQRGKTHAHAVELLRDKYPQYRKMRIEERPVIVVRIERIVTWEARRSPKD